MKTKTGIEHESRTCCPSNSTSINKKVKSQDDSECKWWINSPAHHYCFWVYVLEKSGPDGSMSELVQAEIAELMGWSNTKTHFILKEAMVELVDALNKHKAKDLLFQDHDQMVILPDIEVKSGEDFE